MKQINKAGNRLYKNRYSILYFSFFILHFPIVFCQAPDISYPTVFRLTAGKAIVPVFPVNNGGEVPSVAYGTTTTLAGSTRGFANGSGNNAAFNFPQGITVDASGIIYVADRNNHRIRKVLPDGSTSTVAGTGNGTFSNGEALTVATFNQPSDVVSGTNGDLYVTEIGNHCVRKIAAGQVTTLSGVGSAGFADGDGSVAKFNMPFAITMNSDGILFVADRYTHRIRKVTPTGETSTFAGNGSVNGINAQGANATFNNPVGIASFGNMLYVGDYNNNLIRSINAQQYVSTLAGCFCGGTADGTGTEAGFTNPFGLAVGPSGDIFVADYNANLIRRISPKGEVTTLAGSGIAGNTNGVGNAASFRTPADVAVDQDGNVYVADYANHLIRKIISTGYTISPALPSGLILDPATGQISGTPLEETPSGIYTVIAYNKYGKSITSFELDVQSSNTAIESVKNDLLFVMYPNPLGAEILHIQIPIHLQDQQIRIVIYDATGRMLFENIYRKHTGTIQIQPNFLGSNPFVFVEVSGVGIQKLIW